MIRKLSRKGRKQNHVRENGVFMNKLWNHRVKTSTVQRREVLSARGDKCANAGLHRVLINASVNGASCLGIYYQTVPPCYPCSPPPPQSPRLPGLLRNPSFLSCSGHPTPASSVISLEFIRSERVQFLLHACLLYGMYGGVFFEG